MDPVTLGALGYGLYRGARALLSDEDTPSPSAPTVPDLCNELSYVRGVPYGSCDSIIFKGSFGRSLSSSDATILIYLLDNKGKFIRASDRLNADDDGDLIASADLAWDGQCPRFEALVCADALGNIRKGRPLTARVTAVSEGRAVSRSRFTFKKPSPLLGDGPMPIIDVIAWHMLLLVRAERSLQPNDLVGMVNRVTNYFSLNQRGQQQFRDALKRQARSTQLVSDMAQKHALAFSEAVRLHGKIKNMLGSLLAEEIGNRDEFHTNAHAHILNCLAPLCPGDDVQANLRRLAEAIERELRTEQADRREERERYFRILGVPGTASQEEIERAYREAMREVHPDVIRKLPPRQQRVLEQHARELIEAMEVLRKPR